MMPPPKAGPATMKAEAPKKQRNINRVLCDAFKDLGIADAVSDEIVANVNALPMEVGRLAVLKPILQQLVIASKSSAYTRQDKVVVAASRERHGVLASYALDKIASSGLPDEVKEASMSLAFDSVQQCISCVHNVELGGYPWEPIRVFDAMGTRVLPFPLACWSNSMSSAASRTAAERWVRIVFRSRQRCSRS